jgi:hypothetical protein
VQDPNLCSYLFKEVIAAKDSCFVCGVWHKEQRTKTSDPNNVIDDSWKKSGTLPFPGVLVLVSTLFANHQRVTIVHYSDSIAENL